MNREEIKHKAMKAHELYCDNHRKDCETDCYNCREDFYLEVIADLTIAKDQLIEFNKNK